MGLALRIIPLSKTGPRNGEAHLEILTFRLRSILSLYIGVLLRNIRWRIFFSRRCQISSFTEVISEAKSLRSSLICLELPLIPYSLPPDMHAEVSGVMKFRNEGQWCFFSLECIICLPPGSGGSIRCGLLLLVPLCLIRGSLIGLCDDVAIEAENSGETPRCFGSTHD